MRTSRRWVLTGILAWCSGVGIIRSRAEVPPNGAARAPACPLADVIRRVLERNESLQVKLLDFEVNRRRYRGERGAFEPEAFASASRQVDNRQNSSLQAGSLLGTQIYHGTNNTYDSGLETLMPTGTRVRLGVTLTDLHDTLQPAIGMTNGEWQSFVGFTATQPLLKNFGYASTMAGVRLAALSSKIAFQEYRRQLMSVVSTAEATYWNLYLAQEQVRFFVESVRTAETIVRDNRARFEGGKGSELDVMEAESGLALRRSKLIEAEQKVIEAANQLVGLYGESPSPGAPPLVAADVPTLRSEAPDPEAWRKAAFDLNPDYLIQQEKLDQELVRLGYARNQRLPELDVKGSYGLNGLGQSPSESWSVISRLGYPSWSAGLELRVPIGGGTKSRNEFNAAQLLVESAEIERRAIQTRILNGIDTAWHKVQSAGGSVNNYQVNVKYSQNLLDSVLARLEEGKIDSSKVLQVEADLLEAKNSVAESLVRYEIAHLELEMVEGALLQQRHLEITQEQLESTTRQFLRNGRVGDLAYPGATSSNLLSHAETPRAAAAGPPSAH